MRNKDANQPVGGRCDNRVCCHNREGFCYCVGDCLNCFEDEDPIITSEADFINNYEGAD